MELLSAPTEPLLLLPEVKLRPRPATAPTPSSNSRSGLSSLVAQKLRSCFHGRDVMSEDKSHVIACPIYLFFFLLRAAGSSSSLYSRGILEKGETPRVRSAEPPDTGSLTGQSPRRSRTLRPSQMGAAAPRCSLIPLCPQGGEWEAPASRTSLLTATQGSLCHLPRPRPSPPVPPNTVTLTHGGETWRVAQMLAQPAGSSAAS